MSQEEGQAIEQPTYENPVDHARAILDLDDSPAEEIKPNEETTAETVEEVKDPETSETPETPEVKEEKTEEIELDYDAPLIEIEETREGGVKEKVKLSLNELKKQRMMHSDYTRKTQELAVQRKSLPDEAKKLAEPQLKAAEQALMLANQVVTELVAPELAGMTPQKMAELSQTDPAQFAALLGKQNLLTSQIQNLAARQRQINEFNEKERLGALTKAAQESAEVVQRDIPNWSPEVYDSLLKTGAEYGFAAAELGRVSSIDQLKPVYFTDARIVKLLHDAQKYKELQGGKKALDKKVAVVPKVIKPGTSEKPDPKRESYEKAVSKLHKTGETKDAVALAKFFV